MEIKIDVIKNISPGTPKIIPSNDANTGRDISIHGLAFFVYEISFSGNTDKSGQILLFKNENDFSSDHPAEERSDIQYVVATVIDSTSPIENAIVDGDIEYGIGCYIDIKRIISAHVNATTSDKSIQTSINWSYPSVH
jgi:hypothetical protein